MNLLLAETGGETDYCLIAPTAVRVCMEHSGRVTMTTVFFCTRPSTPLRKYGSKNVKRRFGLLKSDTHTDISHNRIWRVYDRFQWRWVEGGGFFSALSVRNYTGAFSAVTHSVVYCVRVHGLSQQDSMTTPNTQDTTCITCVHNTYTHTCVYTGQ